MLSIFVTFLGAFLTLIVMRPLANWIGLVDKSNYRKRHQGTIPTNRWRIAFCWKSLLLFDGMINFDYCIFICSVFLFYWAIGIF